MNKIMQFVELKDNYNITCQKFVGHRVNFKTLNIFIGKQNF